MAALLSTTPICDLSGAKLLSTAEMALLSSRMFPKPCAMTSPLTSRFTLLAQNAFEGRLGVTCRVVEKRSGIVGSTEAEERKRETKKMEEFMVHRAICLSGSQK